MFNPDFYPTPPSIVIDMVGQYMRKSRYLRILEPSAGKGDILDTLKDVYRTDNANLYAIEMDADLRATLKGKGYRVIDSDFLAFSEPMHFDLIVMNPPFSAGAAHLLKAWDIVAPGGDVVCLLNAETLRNSYTAERRLLASIIAEHGEVKFIGDAFRQAERKTGVEVALVRLHKPDRKTSNPFAGMPAQTDAPEAEAQFASSPLATADMVTALVAQYERARDILRQMDSLYSEYRFYAEIANAKPGDFDHGDALYSPPHLNDQLTALKARFWSFIFARTKIGKLTTSDFQRKFEALRQEQAHMAFTVPNIMSVLDLFLMNRRVILLECIENVFDEATRFHEKNAVHTEGWKTNKSWRLNKTIIMPYVVEFSKWGTWSLDWRRRDFYRDMDKVCCYLSGKRVEEVAPLVDTIQDHLRNLEPLADHTLPFESEFFIIRVYKKGTMHMTFKDLDLLARFNRTAAERKGWSLGDGS
ncbi:MAG: DUF4942 domain-containing protein [Chloroflexota bacterium]|nr:DUF4942 domain-containing protein [Chloroflexota bacterium]